MIREYIIIGLLFLLGLAGGVAFIAMQGVHEARTQLKATEVLLKQSEQRVQALRARELALAATITEKEHAEQEIQVRYITQIKRIPAGPRSAERISADELEWLRNRTRADAEASAPAVVVP